MTIVVQVSDFRNNMAMYLAKLDEGYEIELKKGDRFEAKIESHPKKESNRMGQFLDDVENLRNRFGGIKTKATNMEELNNEIDRILYGADRNGKILSKNDR